MSEDKRLHTEQIHIRLTAEQNDLIRRAAEHSGMTLTNWMRGELLRAARRELRDA